MTVVAPETLDAIRALAPATTPRAALADAGKMLRDLVFAGADISGAASWMFDALALRRTGGARYDVARYVVIALWLACCQANDEQRRRDETRRQREPSFAPDRAALQVMAREAFLAPLHAIVADRGRGLPERRDARQVLVTIALNDERWEVLDALITKTPAKEQEAVLDGLDIATSFLLPGSRAATRTIPEVIRRLEALRPSLQEREGDVLKKLLERLASRHHVPVTPFQTPAAELVDRVLRGATGTMGEIRRQLEELISTDPAQAALLPAITDAPALARDHVAHLHFIAALARGDVAAAHAILDAVTALGLDPSFALDGMVRQPGLDRWVSVVARMLDHAMSGLRSRAVWTLGFALREHGADLAPHAEALLRCALDRTPTGGKLVATETRPVLDAAVAQTQHRARFIEAARDLLAELEPAREKELRAILRKVLPEALPKDVRPRAGPARPANEASLLTAIHEAPDDDGPRLVYADALLEVGDPRGELIVLQCERNRTGATPTPREAALLRTHTRAWLGAAFDLLEPGTIVFERGFLAAATLIGRGHRAKWPTAPDPMWATLERLDVGRALVDGGDILPPDILPQLRTVSGLEHPMLRNLVRTDLEHLAFRTFDVASTLPLLARQERLRTVTVPESWLDPFVRRIGAALPTVTTLASPRRSFARVGTTWRTAQ